MTERNIIAVELSYGADPLHKVDIYYANDVVKASGAAEKPPLIVFIHGGAWRSGDKSEFTSMAKRLVHITRCVVAVANYRLSLPQQTPKEFLHPNHASDVACALETLVRLTSLRDNDSGIPFDNSQIFLIGQSCGAHMLCSLFLEPSLEELRMELSPKLVRSVKGIMIVEGIYDIDLLLVTFPTYKDFIEDALGKKPSYTDLSTTHYARKEMTDHIHWFVVQSPRDTMIDEAQASAAYTALVRVAGQDKVSKDFSTLTEDHDELLQTDEFLILIAKFIARLR